MPKREREYLFPMDLPKGHDHEAWLFAILQSLNEKQELKRDKQVVVTVGPKEWAKFVPISRRSVQTMRRWLKNLERLGRVTVQRITKDTHRVILHYYPLEKGHSYGPAKKAQGQSHTAQ